MKYSCLNPKCKKRRKKGRLYCSERCAVLVRQQRYRDRKKKGQDVVMCMHCDGTGHVTNVGGVA